MRSPRRRSPASTSASASSRPSPVFLSPDGSYSAFYPSVVRRLGAGAIDWSLCVILYLLGSIFGGVFASVGLTSWEAGDLRGIPGATLITISQLLIAAPIVAYFAAYWHTGSTLGMRALDIELAREETGLPPRWGRTIARGCVAFVLALAVNNVYLVRGGDPFDEYSTVQQVVIVASYALVTLLVAAKATMFLDERRRSLLDRAFGLVYLEELVFTHRDQGPWPWSRIPR
jgi:RDD family